MTPREGIVPSRVGSRALRVLVLTSGTGGGHDARAEAFRDWVARLYGAAVEVRIEHALESASPWNAGGVAFYNAIQRHAPWFHHLYYNLGEVFGALQGAKVGVGRPFFETLLREFRPDVILSVHSMLNRGHFAHAKRRLGRAVFCVTYCGEFSGGYGFSRHWVAPEADLFLGRTQEALGAARDLGLPTGKGQCLGQLLRPAFYQPPMYAPERAAYLKDKLGFEPDRFTVLLATGGASAQNHPALLRQLLAFAGRLQAIALCGKSGPTRARLEAWQRRHHALALAILPFSEDMHRLLQIASAVVTRPGTTTCAEALRLGCPIVFNRIGGTMPQEHCTLRYFRALGIAVEMRSAAQLGPILATWLDRPLEHRRHQARLRALRPLDDPEALIRAVIDPRYSLPDVVSQPSDQAL